MRVALRLPLRGSGRSLPDLRCMGLTLFNTLTRRLEPFEPLEPQGRHVRMYCCGPTIHDFAHIGNFRTFVLADFLRRYLEFRGYTTTHVMNITDVEDKIIRRVRETGRSLREYTAVFEAAFLEDHRALNCLSPHHLPRATESIPAIIDLIGRLEQRGIAYRAQDGSVYFSIGKYCGCGHRYGQLFPVDLESLRPGERVSADEYAKESVADFALWKARVPEDGDVFWESPWGQGRPGWHIECSAMSMGLLGPSFDLHLGGEDLVFPHHEDEIAQSEGAGLQSAGQPFVKHWVHGAFLLVEGRKMSKSLGNYYTLRDLLERGFTGREIRYLLLTASYRESFNFTTEGLVGARAALDRLDECAAKLGDLVGGDLPEGVGAEAPLVEACTRHLDQDLNVSAAWGEVFEWVRQTNRALAAGGLSALQAAQALAAWRAVMGVFGLMPAATGTEIPEAIRKLADERDLARKSRDYPKSDALRAELHTQGWLVEDTPKGWKLKRR